MIVFIGDNPTVPTGMGIISKAIIKELSQHFPEDKITVLARYKSLQPVGLPQNVEIIVLPKARFSVDEDAGFIVDFIINNMNKIKFILCQGDIFYFNFFANLRKSNVNIPTIGYLNLDAKDISVKSIETLTSFDSIIFPTEFGLREINKLKDTLSFLKIENIHIIPHGLQPEYKILERPTEKYEKLTFITVANNIMRKNLKTLFKALGELKKKRFDNWQLLLVSRIRGDVDIIKNLLYYDIFDNVSFYENIDIQKLKELYQKSSYLLLTSLGEGFCLPIIEAKSQYTPAILPDNSVFRDVAKESAVYFKADATLQTIHDYVFEAPDFNSLMNRLKETYEDWYYKKKKLYKKLIDTISREKTEIITDEVMAKRIIDIAKNTGLQQHFIPEERIFAKQLKEKDVIITHVPPVISPQFFFRFLILNTIKEKYNKKLFLINPPSQRFPFMQNLFQSIMTMPFESLKLILQEDNVLVFGAVPDEAIIKQYNIDKIIRFQSPFMPLNNVLPDDVFIIYDPDGFTVNEVNNLLFIFPEAKIVFVKQVFNYPVAEWQKRIRMLPVAPLLATPQGKKIIPITMNTIPFYVYDFPKNNYWVGSVPEIFKTENTIEKDKDFVKILSLRMGV